jgi:hypothetical protein
MRTYSNVYILQQTWPPENNLSKEKENENKSIMTLDCVKIDMFYPLSVVLYITTRF